MGITSSGTGSSVSGISNDRSGFGGGGQENNYGSWRSAGGFYPGLNPEQGYAARAPRERIENAQPSTGASVLARVLSMPFDLTSGLFSMLSGMPTPGFDVRAEPNYITGEPDFVTYGTFGPAEGEFGRMPVGDPTHDPHTGYSYGSGSARGGGPTGPGPTGPAAPAVADPLVEAMMAMQARQESMAMINRMLGGNLYG